MSDTYTEVDQTEEQLANAKEAIELHNFSVVSAVMCAEARKDFLAFIYMLAPPNRKDIVMSRFHKFLAKIVQGTFDGELGKRHAVAIPPQHGKLLKNSTQILTKKGWKKHGDLKPGDYVYHISGKPIEVLAEIPQTQKASIEVEISTGEKFLCHPNHEWTLHKDKRELRTVETKELLKVPLWRGERGRRGARMIWQLPFVKALENPDADLPIDPYSFGAWLGDGNSANFTICGIDPEIPASIPYPSSCTWVQENTGVTYNSYANNGLVKKLKEMDVFKNKHIPDVYFTASIAQRLELLAGMIDTDGSLHKPNGHYRFINCNKRLIDDFVSLIYTFGWKCAVVRTEATTSSSGVKGQQPCYQVGFVPDREIPCRLARKKSKKFTKARKIGIVSVRELPPEEHEEGKCITVDSEDGLYLVGRTLQATHNSTFMSIYAAAWILGAQPGVRVAITSFSDTLAKKFSKQIRSIVKSPIYNAIFPEAKVVFGSNRMDDWELTNKSSLTAKAKGSKLTGNRVDYLIVDDPHPGRAEAESAPQRDSVREWFFADCFSRLAPGATVFLIATRWHPGDLTGYLTSDDYVRTVKSKGGHDEVFTLTALPALAEENDPLGREPGEALFPEVRDAKFLSNVRAVTPDHEWSSQYQQRPRSSTAGNFDTKLVNVLDYDDLPEGLEIVRGWDLALTEDRKRDWSVGAMCGYLRPRPSEIREASEAGLPAPLGNFFIIDIKRVRYGWGKLKPFIVSTAIDDAAEHECFRAELEAVGAYDIAFRELLPLLRGRVRLNKQVPNKSKMTYARPWMELAEARKLHVVRGAWNKDFFAEVEQFPDSSVKDDQVDAVSRAFHGLVKKARLFLG